MAAIKSLSEILASKTPFLLDGAIGTELYQRGIFINRCFDEANLTHSDLVLEIHKEYVQMGAMAVTTNTWGANRLKLTQFNLQDQLETLNRRAVELARQAAGDQALVAGTLGPLGVRLEPFGPTGLKEAREIFKEQVSCLAAGGIDFLLLETFHDVHELEQAYGAAREVLGDLPILAQIVIDMFGKMPSGMPLKSAIMKVNELSVEALGLNCSVGPQPMETAIPKIQALTSKPLIMQPNAGLPKQVDGRTIYMCTPEYMGEFAKRAFEAGVQFVGGCCGTTPLHIRAMSQALRHAKAMQAPKFQVEEVTLSGVLPPHELPRVPFAKKSHWSEKIAKGERVYTVELLPPAGVQVEKVIEKSRLLKQAGIDCINIPDGPRASARMSAILTSVLIEKQAGIETILHYTCRDRNLLGMQSDMLGAHAIGLRNMLLVTGDPPKLGDYPNATGVFDVDAIGLTNMVHALNGGVDLGNKVMSEPTAISIGVGVNPGHQDFAYEMKRFRYKVEAGAEWAITQPVFDIDALRRFLDFLDQESIKIPIIAGIWPLLSYKNAVFMNNEVPGVVIPDRYIERMGRFKDPESSKKEGVEIAKEMVVALGNDVQGLQLSAPFGRIDLALQVVGKAVP